MILLLFLLCFFLLPIYVVLWFVRYCAWLWEQWENRTHKAESELKNPV